MKRGKWKIILCFALAIFVALPVLLVVHTNMNGTTTLESDTDTDKVINIGGEDTDAPDETPDTDTTEPDDTDTEEPEPVGVLRYSRTLKFKENTVFNGFSEDVRIEFCSGSYGLPVLMGDVYLVGSEGLSYDYLYCIDFSYSGDSISGVFSGGDTFNLGSIEPNGTCTFSETLSGGSDFEETWTSGNWTKALYCDDLPTDISFQEYLLKYYDCDYDGLSSGMKFLYDNLTQESYVVYEDVATLESEGFWFREAIDTSLLDGNTIEFNSTIYRSSNHMFLVHVNPEYVENVHFSYTLDESGNYIDYIWCDKEKGLYYGQVDPTEGYLFRLEGVTAPEGVEIIGEYYSLDNRVSGTWVFNDTYDTTDVVFTEAHYILRADSASTDGLVHFMIEVLGGNLLLTPDGGNTYEAGDGGTLYIPTTIDFGYCSQNVSETFLTWLTANAVKQ